MKFSDLDKIDHNHHISAMSDPIYQDVKWVIDKFKQYQLETWDTFTWKLMNDYIVFRGYGAVTKGQMAKVSEMLFKYGKQSLIWEFIEETRTQREKDLTRLMNAVRLAIINGNNPEVKKNKRDLTLFLKGAVNLRRGLLVNTFTEKQRMFLSKIERFLGLYYDDLPPIENGMVGITMKGDYDAKGN
jgi:hypothetical protein